MSSGIEVAFRQLLEVVVEEVAERLIREREIHEKVNHKQASHIDNELLIDSAETAKRLGISLATLERKTRSGEIPCIKLGRLVRYSTETLQQWIRESESDKTLEAGRTNKAASRQDSAVKTQNVRKAHSPSALRGPASTTSPLAGSKVQRERTRSSQSRGSSHEDEKPLSPFSKLLQELGVERSDLPPLTNGELMRIAEVDTPTLHGWMYLNHELPESALKKLCDHFAAYRRS